MFCGQAGCLSRFHEPSISILRPHRSDRSAEGAGRAKLGAQQSKHALESCASGGPRAARSAQRRGPENSGVGKGKASVV